MDFFVNTVLKIKVIPVIPDNKLKRTNSNVYFLRNGDEITSPNRRTDLGQVCSI